MAKQYDQELGDKQWQAIYYSVEDREPMETRWYPMNLLDLDAVEKTAKENGYDYFEIVTQTTDIVRYNVV